MFVFKVRGSNRFKNIQSLQFIAAADELGRNSSLKNSQKKKKKGGDRWGEKGKKISKKLEPIGFLFGGDRIDLKMPLCVDFWERMAL